MILQNDRKGNVFPISDAIARKLLGFKPYQDLTLKRVNTVITDKGVFTLLEFNLLEKRENKNLSEDPDEKYK